MDGGCDRAAGDADGDGEDGDDGGSGERDFAGVDEDFVVGQVAGGEEQRAGEDDGGGAEVEHALDGVDGDLGADGKLHAPGDERRADDVGEAAEEGDGGEADELRADEGEGRDPLGGGEEDRPARGAQPVGGIDERDAGGDVNPGDVAELLPEHGPVEVDAATIGVDDEPRMRRTASQTMALRLFMGLASWMLALGLMGAGGEGWICGALAAIELADDAGDVGAGFGVGRDAVVAVDGGGAGVVGGDGEGDVVVVAGEELVEIGGAAADVLFRREGSCGRREWTRWRA